MTTITVVIPAYNLAEVIAATFGSVLRQTSLPDEVLIIDDGSDDQTSERVRAEIAAAPEGLARLIEAAHEGPGAARNRGVFAARGEWTAFLDGDDLWEPGKIAALRRAIEEHPDVSMIAHDNFERLLDGSVVHNVFHRHYDPDQPLLPQLFRVNFLATSCLAVKTKLLREAGGFDPSLAAAQDYDLWLRVARTGRLLFIPEPLETYVRRRGSISTKLMVRYRSVLQIAYRRAPSLVPLVGRFRALLLRFRLIVIAHHYVLTHATFGTAAVWLQVAAEAPFQAVRALLQPVGDSCDEEVA